MNAPAPTELLKLADELRDSEVEEILDTDLLERVEAALRQAASVSQVEVRSEDALRIARAYLVEEAGSGSVWSSLGNAKAIAAIDAALSGTSAQASPDPLAWLAEHTNYELTYSGWDEDPVWQVHSVNGGRNDREWTLRATGSTPDEALRKAMALSLPSAHCTCGADDSDPLDHHDISCPVAISSTPSKTGV